MENSHLFLKSLSLESYMSSESPSQVEMEIFELDSKIKPNDHSKTNDSQKEIEQKHEAINEEVAQITGNVQAHDFFSSLELQSSTKTSTNIISMGFSNKLSGGIVTRSRTFSSTLPESSKVSGKILDKTPKTKSCKQNRKKEKSRVKRRIKSKAESRKAQGSKKLMLDVKSKAQSFAKTSAKLSENILERGLGFEKNKDDDDWLLFNSLTSKKDMDDKIFDCRQTPTNDVQNTVRTPELFSMNSILINDGMPEEKYLVDEFLDVDLDSLLWMNSMDEFSFAPPRSHTGGKWKPASLRIRTPPMLWQGHNGDNFLEDRHHDEEKRNRSETPVDSPTESVNKTSISSNTKWKSSVPPANHTGGKWKPGSLRIRTPPMVWQGHNGDNFLEDRHHDEEKRNRSETPVDSPTESVNKTSISSNTKWKSSAPPSNHTGGKWKPSAPPTTHTGGKWNPLEFGQRIIKLEQDSVSPVESSHNWNQSERETEQPTIHTSGKWKPKSSEIWKSDSLSKPKLNMPSNCQTSGKWKSDIAKTSVDRSTFDVLANCQSTSGKCLKISGGLIQYYCSPCNRRLSSKKMYKKHVQSELHFKRVLQENELEFDSRSLKLFHGMFTQGSYKERGLGKRTIKKPEIFRNSETESLKRDKKISPLVKVKGKRVCKREIIRCNVCKVKVPSYQLGKHLVSYYHSRRIQLNDPEQQKLILDNIHAIVKQAPYQCGMCSFYCNTHTAFKKHWSLPTHKEMEKLKNHRFWCALCSFECETSRLMELHLDSNSHREVILAVNKSIPIIIRHKVIFHCEICLKEFRFNQELIHHKKTCHNIEVEKNSKVKCSICGNTCRNQKSLQRHVLTFHKGVSKVPYFCSSCNTSFSTAEEAKLHRNSQLHKVRKKVTQEKNPTKVTLSRSCIYCKETLESIEKFKIHLLKKHHKFLPKCMKCGMVFALSQEVSQHVKNNECDFSLKKVEASNALFHCDICPFTTNTKSEFLLHTAIHEKKSKDEKKISCPLCSGSFSQSSLSVHLRTHLKERTYDCSICSKAFVRKDRYLNHLKLKHGKKYDFESLENLKKISLTELKKADEKELEEIGDSNDENSNTKEREMKNRLEARQSCGDPKCKYIAKNEEDLKNHTLFHVGPKIFQCPDCPYSAQTNTRMKRHYMIHVDERLFPCHLCSFKARFKSHLKRHMRLHTGAKPYKCPHCSYTCNILENLRKHVLHTKIHPGKKLYECKLCDFSTNVSKEFKAHLCKNHKDFYKPIEANEAAGIYNKVEDCKNSSNPVVDKSKTSTVQPAKRVYPAGVKKKMEIITQKFSAIAPKPSATNEAESFCKNTGNSVEDKRKLLKLELEKLKNRIKPEKEKYIKSYPSPAEKELKMKSNIVIEDCSKNIQLGKNNNPCRVGVLGQSHKDSEVFLVNVPPTVVSTSKETVRNDIVQQQMDLPSGCVLYENVLPSEEMEFCLMEDYQI